MELSCSGIWIFLSVTAFYCAVRSDANKLSDPLLVENGKFNVSQIKATGITDDRILSRLQKDCCVGKKGIESGLCLSATANKPTIEIHFKHVTKVGAIVIQAPADCTQADCSVGFLKGFKIMYKENRTDTIAKFYGPNEDHVWNFNNPQWGQKSQTFLIISEPVLEVLIIEIDSFEGAQPCLRMEVMGCLEKNCPVMRETPTVDAVDSGDGNNTAIFQCSVKGDDRRFGQLPKVFHKATWFHDGKNLTGIQTVPTDQNDISTIHQQDIYGYLPDSANPDPNYIGGLKCSVTACGASGCNDWESPPKESNELLPTATYDLGPGNTSVTIQQGQGGVDISLRLNGPPVLFLKKDIINAAGGTNVLVEARFNVRMKSPCITASSPRHDVVIADNCGHNITSGNWKDLHKLTLKAVTDGLYGPDAVIRKCNLFLKHLDNTSKTISKTKFTEAPFDVKVEVADGWTTPVTARSTARCYASNDPRLRTFDGSYYSVQAAGEFIMYRNKKYNYQVNARFVPCNGRWGTCVCGVAVKAGDDVVVMSSCPTTSNPYNTPFRIYVWKNGNLTPGLKVYRRSLYYYVYLPTGTYVRVVAIYRWFGDPLIVSSLADLYQTEGLCGDYNGKWTDDFKTKGGSLFTFKNDVRSSEWYNKYADEWREDIQPCNSIFFGVEEDQHVPVQTYCTCILGSNSYDCGQHKDFVPCLPNTVVDVTPKESTNMTNGLDTKVPVKTPHLSVCSNSTKPTKGRKKRSATYTPPVGEDDEYQSFVFNRSFVPKTLSWPTASGWTEEKARKNCKDFILTKDALKNCQTFMGTTFEAEINDCVSDIQVSDSTDFVKSTLMNILSQCLSEAEKYPATTTELPGGIDKTTLYESLCLDNCNNNGVCKDARCVCNPGFYGGTCSLTKDIPPNIVYMSRNGLCNTRTRDCTFSYVFGTGHIESTDLKCRMTPYNHRTGVRDLKGQFTSTAIYVNFNLLVCPHNNKNGTFLVAVSNNNGKDYSKDELLFLAYDSACHNCSSVDQDEKKANCTQETYGCAVGSACYLDGEVDEGNICWSCDTNRNIDNWSVNTAYSNCTTAPEDNIALIAGVTTAAVLVVAIIITVVLTLKFCGKKKSVSPPSAADIQAEAGRSAESIADEPKPENADNRKMSGVSVSSITPAWTA